ncbi:hypothetical protein ACIQOW_32815 [Kitasatospora sp. NPDC091335]|uniref:hypothetical protein n=1 Tax=Kitasatospora sp. NPDC091335 TaxID=3364085 RepID=UPI00382E0926
MNTCINHAGLQRHGRAWEPADKRRLTLLRAEGVGFAEIARLLGRTEAAVRAQAKKPAPAAAPCQSLPARMRAAELLEQRDRTGLTFEQMAARAGILSGPGILYVVADEKNQLSPHYTNAIRALPDAVRRAAPALTVVLPDSPPPGFVNVVVPERLAATVQMIVHAMGAQR